MIGILRDPVEDRPLAGVRRICAPANALQELSGDDGIVQQILANRVSGEPGKPAEYCTEPVSDHGFSLAPDNPALYVRGLP
ncbi:MAG: hypothetical protein ACLQKA_18040 [Bryobacteraceae bacterium]